MEIFQNKKKKWVSVSVIHVSVLLRPFLYERGWVLIIWESMSEGFSREIGVEDVGVEVTKREKGREKN